MSPNARVSVLERFGNFDCSRLFLEVKAAGGSVMQDNIEETLGGMDASIIYARTVTLSDGEE